MNALEVQEDVRRAALQAMRVSAALRSIARVAPKRRRDLPRDYVDAVVELVARDAARACAAALANDIAEHHRLGRIVAARCFGLFEHPDGERVTAALVGGAGHTAAGWSW